MQKTPQFIGLDTQYPTADGGRLTRLHLDGAASPLAAKKALETITKLLPHYSNTHSNVHSSAQISTKAFAWAHETVLNYVGVETSEYAAIFTGSGTTSAINRVARGLKIARPDRDVVLVSSMEHHANDLPHRQFDNKVVYLPLRGDGAHSGNIDLNQLAQLCEQYSDTANYIAISSVSNVTGVSNEIDEVCQIAHEHNILVLVDGAQSVAHRPTRLAESSADFFVFSGHKIYTPMSPGVLVAKRSLLRDLGEQDLGGGSVSTVSYYDYHLVNDETEKEESGTPNIVGAIALASVLDELMSYGLSNIALREQALMETLIEKLGELDEIRVYADPALKRVGALAFNHSEIDHGLFAAILNDYFAIAVRNECFCAHPYVSHLLKDELWQLDLSDVDEDQQESYINRKRGMVRASLSLYNSAKDIERLIDAIKSITENLNDYVSKYQVQNDGSYTHASYRLNWKSELNMID